MDAAFIFYFNGFIAGFTIWNVPEINYRLKLDVRGWAECVHLQLEGLVATLACDLDHVVEFALRVRLELDV